MVPQFHSWYLGMAHPFTLPLAVGGYDIPHQDRWRRPEDNSIPSPSVKQTNWFTSCQSNIDQDSTAVVGRTAYGHDKIGPACKVKLYDLTRGMPQRIEGQFRRHWGFGVAVWSLYFRERINLGVSMCVKSTFDARRPNQTVDEDRRWQQQF